MSRPRLLAAIGLGLLAGAVVVVSDAWAGVEEPAPVEQDGWTLAYEPLVVAGDVIRVAGERAPPGPSIQNGGALLRVARIDVSLARTLDSSTACPANVAATPLTFPENDDDPEREAGEPPGLPSSRTQAFTVDIAVPCNGTYAASLTAVADSAGRAPGAPSEADDMPTASPIAIPDALAVNNGPPAIPLVVSDLGADRRIIVGWQPPTGWGEASSCGTVSGGSPPPDFLGYEVRRSVNGGPTTAVASPAPGTQCFSEVLTAESPLGDYRYEVVARRGGVDGPLFGAAVATTVSVGPPSTAPAASASTTVFRPPAPPDTAAASSSGAATGTVPPTTSDDGTFEETLDYDEPGELAADVPDDADTFLDFVPSPGQGILVPFAIAECLAVWALHLRYLTRRADDGY